MKVSTNTGTVKIDVVELRRFEQAANDAGTLVHLAAAVKQSELQTKADTAHKAILELLAAYTVQRPRTPSLPGQRSLPGVEAPPDPKLNKAMTAEEVAAWAAGQKAGPKAGEWRVEAGGINGFTVFNGMLDDHRFLTDTLRIQSHPFYYSAREYAEKTISDYNALGVDKPASHRGTEPELPPVDYGTSGTGEPLAAGTPGSPPDVGDWSPETDEQLNGSAPIPGEWRIEEFPGDDELVAGWIVHNGLDPVDRAYMHPTGVELKHPFVFQNKDETLNDAEEWAYRFAESADLPAQLETTVKEYQEHVERQARFALDDAQAKSGQEATKPPEQPAKKTRGKKAAGEA